MFIKESEILQNYVRFIFISAGHCLPVSFLLENFLYAGAEMTNEKLYNLVDIVSTKMV